EHEQEDLMEESSFYTSFSGMKFPVTLPKITVADKKAIMGAAEAPGGWPAAKGLPLFWQESKSCSFYKSLFQTLKPTLAIDAEIGSGQAAQAALQLGISYVGIAKHTSHMNFVANAVDKSALRHIVETGHMLFNKQLSESINEIFKSELEESGTEEPITLEGEAPWEEVAAQDK
ncbi:unnamed protein product, partial [Effrenium voratum]